MLVGGRLAVDLYAVVTDLNESAFSILGAPHRDPPKASRQASRLERNDSYILGALGGNVDGPDDSLNNDIDAIGIGGADVVTKLGVTVQSDVSVRAHEGKREAEIQTSSGF